jgi:hypothetical protein
MKILPVGIEFFNADGQSDTTNSTVAFRNFTNCLKMVSNKFRLMMTRCFATCSEP